MLRSLILLCAVILILPHLAQAQSIDDPKVKKLQTAETMMELCEGTIPNERPDFQSQTCSFRIQGVVSMMIMNCLSSSDQFYPDPLLSASPPASNKAIRQTFINYMKTHPEYWGQSWAVVLSLAVSEKFPCEEA